MRVLLAAATAMLVISCSLDYSQNQLASRISEDVPDTVLFSVVHTIVRDGSPRFRVVAERAETYAERKRQYLTQVEFTEFAPDGAVATTGTAERAEYQTDTEDVELSGDLRFYSSAEDAWLTADYLYWNADDRRLTSIPDQPVRVRKGDGTAVTGRGFVAEMSRSTISFQDGVQGTLVESDE